MAKPKVEGKSISFHPPDPSLNFRSSSPPVLWERAQRSCCVWASVISPQRLTGLRRVAGSSTRHTTQAAAQSVSVLGPLFLWVRFYEKSNSRHFYVSSPFAEPFPNRLLMAPKRMRPPTVPAAAPQRHAPLKRRSPGPSGRHFERWAARARAVAPRCWLSPVWRDRPRTGGCTRWSALWLCKETSALRPSSAPDTRQLLLF